MQLFQLNYLYTWLDDSGRRVQVYRKQLPLRPSYCFKKQGQEAFYTSFKYDLFESSLRTQMVQGSSSNGGKR